MLSQGKIGVSLKMFGEPLPQGLALQCGSTGDRHRLYVPRKASPLEPALDGGQRDPKELCDLLSGDAAVYCGERLQPEVLRVCVHGPYFRAGPLLTQYAVRALVFTK